MVLDNSTKPMSLNRVPPNLLVGAGAADFAYENGMPILHADFLVAKGSKERWLRWTHDLDQLEDPGNQTLGEYMEIECPNSVHSSTSAPCSPRGTVGSGPAASRQSSLGLISAIQPLHRSGNPRRVERVNSVPISDGSNRSAATISDRHQSPVAYHDNVGEDYMDDTSVWRRHSPSLMKATNSSCTPELVSMPNLNSTHESFPTTTPAAGKTDLTVDPHSLSSFGGSELADSTQQPRFHPSTFSQRGCHKDTNDSITDTVGAIAVDCYGNIAAGSSSGGIGMKHSGRTGPAALVGIGTAVIPIDPEDEMKTCVAVVTSGTGEHMATTMASSLCAERIYSSTRKKQGLPGVYESVSEDEAMEAMIATDFMGMIHQVPSSSPC